MADPFQVQLQRVTGAAQQQQPKQPAPAGNAQGASFLEALEKAQGVRFSNHAQSRLQSRDITLDSDSVNRLAGAIDKAEKRGGKSSLVMVDDLAFIVNVQSRTVVTAMDRNQGTGEGVFTQIDSVVFADPSETSSKSSIDLKG